MSKDINLDTHIADIANLVEWEDLTDICLVAWSYGYPASGALERIGNRVSSIIWVDALKLRMVSHFATRCPLKRRMARSAFQLPKRSVHAYKTPRTLPVPFSNPTTDRHVAATGETHRCARKGREKDLHSLT